MSFVSIWFVRIFFYTLCFVTFKFCHNLSSVSFWVLSKFEFAVILFCHHFSLSQHKFCHNLNFVTMRVVTIWILSHLKCCHNLGFVTIWVRLLILNHADNSVEHHCRHVNFCNRVQFREVQLTLQNRCVHPISAMQTFVHNCT